MLFLFVLCVLIQLYFAWWYRYRPGTAMPEPADTAWPKLSVLICGKNEADNWKRCLIPVLQQDYPADKFEVLVVDDGSTDNSLQILSALRQQFPTLKILSLHPDTVKTFPGKKHALWRGLKACVHPLVLLTDADCVPASTLWLRRMARAYIQAGQQHPGQACCVLGYGDYVAEPGLLHRFIRWETVHTFQQYASWARSGKAYMGVGRNLLYERAPVLQLLETDADFAAVFARTASGDDDLIVSRLSADTHMTVLADPEAKTLSIAKNTWSGWWKQKTRHVSSGKYYSTLVKRGLALYAFSLWGFWLTALYLICSAGTTEIQIIVLILGLCRIGLSYRAAAGWYRALDVPGPGWFWIPGDLMWVLYNMMLAPFIFFKNKQQWK